MASHDLLLKFGQTVFSPRDRVFDQLSSEAGSSALRYVLSSAQSGDITAIDIIDIIKYAIDKYIVELMYEMQDLKLEKTARSRLSKQEYPIF